MFDLFRTRPQSGNSLGRNPAKCSPRLESLEDRLAPAVIGGTVFADLNNTGLLSSNDFGIGGATIKLYDSTGVNLLATTTSSNGQAGQLPLGQYQFTNLDASAVHPATETFDAVFQPSPANTNAVTTLKQFDPSLGTLTEVDISATGSLNSTAQLENLSPQAAQFQVNLNGSLAFGAPGLASSSSSTSLGGMTSGTLATETNGMSTTGSYTSPSGIVYNSTGTTSSGSNCTTNTGTTTGSTNGVVYEASTSTSGSNCTTNTGTSTGTNTSTIFGTTGSSLTSGQLSSQLTATLSGFQGGQINLSGPSSQTLSAPAMTGSFSSVQITNPSVLQAYTGTGTVNVTENAAAMSDTCGPGNLLALINTMAQGDVTVVYHYTPSTNLTTGNYKVVETTPIPGYTVGLTSANGNVISGSNVFQQSIAVTLQSQNDVSTNNNFAWVPEPVAPPPPPNLIPNTPIPPTNPPTTPNITPTTSFMGKYFLVSSNLSDLGWTW